MSDMKNKILLYHADCPDGFGARFAFWKKYGEEMSYLPVKHGEPPPEGLEGKEVFIADFVYPKDILLDIERRAERLVVLDHHFAMREATESVKEHVFDNDRSGAGIAWGYVHPEVPLPRLIAYVQENDLWRSTLPHSREVASYLSTIPFDLAVWDRLMAEMDDDAAFQKIVEKGTAFREYQDHACAILAGYAEEVEFEGYRILTVNVPRLFRSEVGHLLADKKGPFAIVWYQTGGKKQFSIRGDGSVDCAAIAARYGGSGHHDAAGFRLPADAPLPWKS